MSWNDADKELCAVAVSVAAGCRPCTHYHVRKAREANVSVRQLAAAVEAAVEMRVAAAASMREFALRELGGPSNAGEKLAPRLAPTVALSTGLGVNCSESTKETLRKHPDLALDGAQLHAILELSRMVKERAAHHAEKLVEQAIERTRPASD